jgi:hypothetical protein
MPDIDFGIFVGVVMAIVPAIGVWVKLNITLTKLCAEQKHTKERLDGMGKANRQEFKDIEVSRAERVSDLKSSITRNETSIVKLWEERDKMHDKITKLEAKP